MSHTNKAEKSTKNEPTSDATTTLTKATKKIAEKLNNLRKKRKPWDLVHSLSIFDAKIASHAYSAQLFSVLLPICFYTLFAHSQNLLLPLLVRSLAHFVVDFSLSKKNKNAPRSHMANYNNKNNNINNRLLLHLYALKIDFVLLAKKKSESEMRPKRRKSAQKRTSTNTSGTKANTTRIQEEIE